LYFDFQTNLAQNETISSQAMKQLHFRLGFLL